MSSDLSSPLASPKEKRTVTKAKKPTTRSAKPKGDHPSWKDIIRECIAAHPEEARSGVSRSTIKKFAEDRYGLEPTAANIAHLSRAIANGEGEIFALPKGKSGKVKLYKGSPSTTKENKKPVSARKSTTATKKPSSAGDKSKRTVVKAVKKSPTDNAKTTSKNMVEKPKKTTALKKTSGKGTLKPTVKKLSAVKVPSKKATTTKKATTATKPKKVSSRKVEAKKPAAKAAAVKAMRAATKAPGSKTKPSSKTKSTTTRATRAKA